MQKCCITCCSHSLFYNFDTADNLIHHLKQHLWLFIHLLQILLLIPIGNKDSEETTALQKERDEDAEYSLKHFKFTVWFKEKTGLPSTFETGNFAKFVFFIYKMTLLVRIVGGSKLTPYDSNCSESLCVLVCAECSGVCVSVHQTELQGLRHCGEVDEVRIAEGRCQRGDITLHITPTQPG